MRVMRVWAIRLYLIPTAYSFYIKYEIKYTHDFSWSRFHSLHKLYAYMYLHCTYYEMVECIADDGMFVKRN